jgi:hypothetical protein
MDFDEVQFKKEAANYAGLTPEEKVAADMVPAKNGNIRAIAALAVANFAEQEAPRIARQAVADFMQRLLDHTITKQKMHGEQAVYLETLRQFLADSLEGKAPAPVNARPKKQDPVYDVGAGYQPGEFVPGVGFIGGTGARAEMHVHRSVDPKTGKDE